MTIEEYILIRYGVEVRSTDQAEQALARMTSKLTARIRRAKNLRCISGRDVQTLLDDEMARSGLSVVRQSSNSPLRTDGAEPDQWWQVISDSEACFDTARPDEKHLHQAGQGMTIEEFMLIRYDVDVRSTEAAEEALARMTSELEERIGKRGERIPPRDVAALLDDEMAGAGLPVVRDPSSHLIFSRGPESDRWYKAMGAGDEVRQARAVEKDKERPVVGEVADG